MALATTSLSKRGADLSDTAVQLKVLNNNDELSEGFPKFNDMLSKSGVSPLHSSVTEIMQINLGKMCNQVCKHCHVDAGPDRKEIMTRQTMQECLDALARTDIQWVDLTGGAPEMNPDFRWFVEEVTKLGRSTMVRCNLTIIVANKKYHDLPEFFKENNVHVISSLPFYDAKNVDRQRGDGVFEDSMRALTMLNAAGYGMPGSGLVLDLVYNPVGALLPGPQAALESQFKKALKDKFEIEFNSLICITNMPISRYLEYLIDSGNYASYMQKLVDSFNPMAADGVMCKNTISVSWDGLMYDCDFNQMLELPLTTPHRHVRDLDVNELDGRRIVVNQHCFGCTAGAGSSCGGQLT